MNANLKSVFPRAARKLSTASVSSIQPHSASLLFFEPASPSQPQPQPRIITTALTTTNTPTSSSTSSSSKAPAPLGRYATNSSHPAPHSIPPVFFIPPSQSPPVFLRGSYNSRHSEGHERNSYKLDMGAYGIPKRRKTRSGNPSHSADSSNPAAGSARPSSPESTSSTSSDDPAAYTLSVQVGEDAYFTRPNAMGVADGVGGWKHSRRYTGESHSALLAKKLMHFCSLELAEGTLSGESQGGHNSSTGTASAQATTSTSATHSSPPFPASPPSSTSQPLQDQVLDPVKILQHSYEKCIADAHAAGHVTGSTTALLAVLVGNELRIAHLGDCALCLVRDGEMIYRSEEMQHSFNYPFQLGPASSTTPTAHAQKITIQVQPNDILILASDGMGDNLWDEDVLDEVKRFVGANSPSDNSASASQARATRGIHGPVTNGVLAQRLSEALASRAKRVSERSNNQDTNPSESPEDKSSSPQVSDGDSKTRKPTITVGAVSEGSAQEAQEVTPRTSESPRNSEKEDIEEDPEYVSDEVPFGRKAREAGLRFVGGKNDDISVLVAVISGPTVEQAPTGIHPQLNLHFDRTGFR